MMPFKPGLWILPLLLAVASPALAEGDATLDKFLAAPGGIVPGTKMLVGLTSATDRADVIAYLKTAD